jgi:sugar/nucleoside kinase (ribokinase family)
LDYNLIPDPWRSAPIVHLGPIAQEVEPSLVRNFPASLIGLTPQGWLRHWNSQGRVFPCEWPEATFVLQRAGAAIISVEDVAFDEGRIEEMASSCRIFVVTEADQGSRLYWNGDVRRFRRQGGTVDATGAGDIYAAAFFAVYTRHGIPEAARFATQLSATPSPDLAWMESYVQEIEECLVEVY